MKNLALSIVLIMMTLYFWGWIYNGPAWLPQVEQTLIELEASRKNTSPYIVVMENKWAHQLYRFWHSENQFVLLTPWDVTRGYERKKKKFTCQKDMYWLGESEPSKQLLKWGHWKQIKSESDLFLFQKQDRP